VPALLSVFPRVLNSGCYVYAIPLMMISSSFCAVAGVCV